jgi:hypothetical protein
MADTISWVATIATVIAASMTAANLGSKITGTGFAVFLVGSLAWLATGLLTDQPALVWTNAVLTVLNVFGVWRWLGRQSRVEEGGRAASEASEHTPGEALFPVSLLTRAPVRSGTAAVGTCIDAMAGCDSGRLVYVVVSQGGVAGMGETLRRLPWARSHADEDAVLADLGGDGVESLEELARDLWPARCSSPPKLASPTSPGSTRSGAGIIRPSAIACPRISPCSTPCRHRPKAKCALGWRRLRGGSRRSRRSPA